MVKPIVGWQLAMWRVKTGLDEVLALWLGDKQLELRGSKCIDQSGFRHDK